MAGLAFTALALLLVLAYLIFVLPRLRTFAGIATSLLMAVVLGAGAWLLSRWALPALSWPVLFVALVYGHLGWIRGLRGAHSTSLERPPATTMPMIMTTQGRPDRAMLGRYRVDNELGRGAMGAVYLGHDPKIGRQVAIKTMALSREFAGDALAEARKRFFREAETAGRLQHPDIVTIFDAGEDQDLAYIAMEYLRGEDLQKYTQAPRLLPVSTVMNVVARVADALGYAHSQGVVHRDIKPANVVVDLPTGTVKVTDFGIAHLADTNRTRTGMVLGTPSFMAPEQMAGRRVDGRSDLYSLGVMLFQLLTGKLPHRSESMATLMQQIANEPAPDVRSLRAELPVALSRVVALALEKRPELRYATGQQMAADLRAIANDYLEPNAATSASEMPMNPRPPTEFEATAKLERLDTGHNSDL